MSGHRTAATSDSYHCTVSVSSVCGGWELVSGHRTAATSDTPALLVSAVCVVVGN